MPLLYNGRTYPAPHTSTAQHPESQRPDTYTLVWDFLKRYAPYDSLGKPLQGTKPEGMEVRAEGGLHPSNAPLNQHSVYTVRVPVHGAQEWTSSSRWDLQLDMLNHTDYLLETSWPSTMPAVLKASSTASSGPPRGEGLHLPYMLQASITPKLPASSRAVAQKGALAHMKLKLDIDPKPDNVKLPTEVLLQATGPMTDQQQKEKHRESLKIKEEHARKFGLMQRDQFLRLSRFSWGFNCAVLGDPCWGDFQVAIYPCDEERADAFVMPRGWLEQDAHAANRRIMEAQKLVLILDMDQTILHCMNLNSVPAMERSRYQSMKQQGLAIDGFNNSEILIPRKNLLEVVRMAYGLDSEAFKPRFDILFCTSAGGSRGCMYLERLRHLLTAQCRGNEQLILCVEDATKGERLVATHCGGLLWKKKDVQDIIPGGLLTDMSNKLTIIVDDSEIMWVGKYRSQVVRIRAQQDSRSYQDPEAVDRAALQQLLACLSAVHRQQVQSGYVYTIAEALQEELQKGGYDKLNDDNS